MADQPGGRTRWRRRVVFGGGAILWAALTAVTFIDARAESATLLGLVVAASAAYVAALWAVRGWTMSRRELTWCLLLALTWRLPLAAAAPVLSDDVYRYVWDGRVQRLGYNPFETAPADPALEALQTDVTRRIDPTSAALPTIYPPAAQLFFRAVTAVHESVGALLLATLLCDALIVWVLWQWLGASGGGAMVVLAYAWHPLVAIEGAGGGHVDLLGTLLVVGSAWLLTRRRTLGASIVFVVAVAVKFLPIVLAPLFWGRVRVRDMAVAGAVGVGLYLPFLGTIGGLPTGSLGTYTEKWRFNGPLFAWLEPSVGIVGSLCVAVGAGLLVAAAARRWLGPEAPSAWAWPVATTVLLLPAIYPWYLLWVTPFLSAPALAPLVAWTLASLLTYAVWGPALSGLGWVLPDWVMPVEYGLVAATAVLTLWMWRRHRRA